MKQKKLQSKFEFKFSKTKNVTGRSLRSSESKEKNKEEG